MKSYEFIGHTADVAIRAVGRSIEEAFAAAADGLFALIVGEEPVQGTREVTLEVESIDLEGLLVTFLSELLVRFEVERVVLTDFEVAFTGANGLTATAWGEPFNEERHGQGYHVKGVSYHMIEIAAEKRETPAHVQVLLDI